jgi:hypothetical protein
MTPSWGRPLSGAAHSAVSYPRTAVSPRSRACHPRTAQPIKLAHALTAFGINATGAVALDLGAAGDGGLAIMALTWCHHD